MFKAVAVPWGNITLPLYESTESCESLLQVEWQPDLSSQQNIFSLDYGMHSVPQWPSDISGNDWLGPINSSPAADRMSDEIFGANLCFFFGRNLSLGHAKNDHVCPLGLAINCEEVKKE